jgi:hypothetical protein
LVGRADGAIADAEFFPRFNVGVGLRLPGSFFKSISRWLSEVSEKDTLLAPKRLAAHARIRSRYPWEYDGTILSKHGSFVSGE